ncbi:magnesium transporter [Pseudorhizobium tarimense]|uniref:Magnesium transporter n=1 Tax=Pseudorhizobium tarimense TaxID=1079109 RepID=A0ABV2HDR3_9HYPH|nr:magnesium transporter CorA family protein [Pseudorhizobium tarimense]MCJ8520994.1 magnesium transporter CorA family protein [Pseudorhizobium tarimense]MCJ8521025.1 magnesium transporter CorA family protein [Pseudorhizobium tarimense]
MLIAYEFLDGRLHKISQPSGAVGKRIWLDLLSPTPAEDQEVEKLLGISIPTREEMDEIELSARLYQEDRARFMTIIALTALGDDKPNKTPITFILKDEVLVTVRYEDPTPFQLFVSRSQKPTAASIGGTGELVMLGLLEALTDRLADALERVGDEIETFSSQVFRNKSSNAKKNARNLEGLIEQIGRKNDYLSLVQESLVSISRLVAYHAAAEGTNGRARNESRQRVKLIQRDVTSLGEHSKFLAGKINFLLDAILGLINLEQNQIIKIFSVAAVVFLPPTLVASIYGMNFEHMPELGWRFGYPWAIGLMIFSAIMPFLYFKRRGWL